MPARTSQTWKANGNNVTIEEIDAAMPTKDNLVDMLFAMNKDQISYRFIMNTFGEFNGKTLANPYDLLIVPAHTFSYYTDAEKTKHVSNTSQFTTTLGIYILNIYIRDFNFSRLFGGYVQRNINKKNFGYLEQTLSFALIEDKITTQELKEWEDTLQLFMPFEYVLSPNHTEKMITCTKMINKKKAELLKKYKKEVEEGNPAAIENIEQELLAYAREYMGDDPSMDTLYSGTMGNFDNNFKNMFVMKGAMRDPDPNAKQKYRVVTGSLIDGIPANEYSTIAGGATEGAYSRGKKTENGGYFEKLFVSAYNTIILDPPGSDCGTKNHIEVELTDKNIIDYMYSYIIKPNGSLELLNSENMNSYIGKKVKLRFASMCESKTGICNKCAGDLFYRMGNNDRVGLVMSSIPDKMKLASMKGLIDVTLNCLSNMEPPYIGMCIE